MMEKYKVTGMTCAACSSRVEKAVGALAGVESCSVNLLTGDMSVGGEVTREAVISAVVGAGYGVEEEGKSKIQDDEKSKDGATRALLIRLFVSLVLVFILMYFSMGHMLGLPDPLSHNVLANGLIQMLIAAVVMVINQRFFINGAKGILRLSPNMDTLVALGSLASFGYSFAMLILMSYDVMSGGDGSKYLHELYFESAAMILALITLGKMLESRAKGKTTDALKGLIALKGKYATVLTDDGEKIISVDDIKIGDVLVVRSGESIPTDGRIIEGDGTVDESMLTGESIPRDVLIGDKVYGGSINKSGFLKISATEVGEGTVLANIIQMVKDASSSKAPIAKLADKVSAVFVPSVMALSCLTLAGWLIAGREVGYAVARAISVLVISCPCALGLATPVAIMVGSGVAARRGVLFKTAASLEESGRVRTVALDKTGTITEGKPTVTDVLPSGISSKELLNLALTLEEKSEHPLARSVVAYAKEKGATLYDLTDFKTLTGRGVYGKIGGQEIRAVSFYDAVGQDLAGIDPEIGEKLSDEGKTPICFIYGGKYVGTIALSDTLKTDAEGSVRYLKSMGLKVVMLSGDNERTARAVAKKAGIDEVIAGVLPDGKEAVIRSLSEGGKVAMVGDGINDAPALTKADVGIAIGRGTDIAIDSADVVVMGNTVSEVAYAISIGRATLVNIRENLFWAFIYNCFGIPLAMGLFGLSLSPMIGAAMMSLSSFSVVMNALRLNLWKPKKITLSPAPCEENTDKSDENNNENTDEIIETENEKMNIVIKVDGMMCPHCEARVKKACEGISGVTLATPSHVEGTVVIEAVCDVRAECEAAIAGAGYDVIK